MKPVIGNFEVASVETRPDRAFYRPDDESGKPTFKDVVVSIYNFKSIETPESESTPPGLRPATFQWPTFDPEIVESLKKGSKIKMTLELIST